MTITAETITRTYKCDWCGKTETLTKNIDKLPQDWVPSNGDAPVGEHFCSWHHHEESKRQWEDSWHVGMDEANVHYEKCRQSYMVNGNFDSFRNDLQRVAHLIEHLVNEVDNEMYVINNPNHNHMLRDLELQVDTLIRLMYSNREVGSGPSGE